MKLGQPNTLNKERTFTQVVSCQGRPSGLNLPAKHSLILIHRRQIQLVLGRVRGITLEELIADFNMTLIFYLIFFMNPLIICQKWPATQIVHMYLLSDTYLKQCKCSVHKSLRKASFPPFHS